MGQYKPERPPGHYPKCVQDVFWQAAHGAPGQEFRTFYKEFPGKGGRSSANVLSSFKASVRYYPLHPLHEVIDSIRTQTMFVNKLNTTEVYFVAWRVVRIKHRIEMLMDVG